MIKEICVAGVTAVAACLLRSEYEKKQLTVWENTISSCKIKKDHKLVFLSDLHDEEFGKQNQRLIQEIDSVHPDMILIGGDMMVAKKKRKGDLRVTLDFIRKLADRYPIYYANGNHEQRMNEERMVYGERYDELCAEFKKLGIIHLSDSNVVVDEDLAISGLEIEKRFYKKLTVPHMNPEYLSSHLGEPKTDRFQILLAHSPLFEHAYAEWGADLSLSGHFHGGTIRLPFLGGVMTPQFQFFQAVCGGRFEEHGKFLIVSRGLGTHSIRIRLNNKPQVVVIRLTKETTK